MAELLDLYRTERCTWGEFVEGVWPVLIRQIQVSSNGNRTQATDAATDFYPELQRVASAYRDTGSTFEAYLRTNIRYFCRKQVTETGDRQIREVVTEPESPIFDGLIAHEAVPCPPERRPYPFPKPQAETMRSRDATRRQLLFILCSNLPVLSSPQLERYAMILDVPVSWLTSLQTVSLTLVEKRRERKHRLAERRDRHFSFFSEYQRRAQSAPTEQRRARLLYQQEFHYERWRRCEDRIRRHRCTLSHREVAMLLGVPKGSVDSAMNSFRLKVEDTRGDV